MRDTRAVAISFVSVWLLLELIAIAALATHERLALHASINCCHSSGLDAFFKVFTHVADGLVPTFLALLLLLRDWRSFMMMGLSCGLSAIVVQLLKRNWFADQDRPSMFKEELGTMDWVSGIELHQHFSFPSGHSTAAFAMCFSVAIIFAKNRWPAALLSVLAASLAFSRIYLSQHFLRDAAAGSALGLLVAMAIWWWLYRSPFASRRWLNRTPIKRQNQ